MSEPQAQRFSSRSKFVNHFVQPNIGQIQTKYRDAAEADFDREVEMPPQEVTNYDLLRPESMMGNGGNQISLSHRSPVRGQKDFINRNIENIRVYQERVASLSPKDQRCRSPWKRYNFDKDSDHGKRSNRFSPERINDLIAARGGLATPKLLTNRTNVTNIQLPDIAATVKKSMTSSKSKMNTIDKTTSQKALLHYYYKLNRDALPPSEVTYMTGDTQSLRLTGLEKE